MRRRPSGAVQHFWELCEQPFSRSATEKALSEWTTETGTPANTIGRSIKRFIGGDARLLSAEVKPYFTRFCRDKLGLDIGDDEFDITERFRDYVGEFAEKNEISMALLDACAGNYVLFRPRQENGRLVPILPSELRKFELEICAEGNSGRYAFNAKIGSDGLTWAGHAICADRFLYLIGFQQDNHSDVLLMTLTSLEVGLRAGDVLVGTQIMRLNHSHDEGQHQAVVGRVVALARCGARQAAREALAKAWLAEKQLNDTTGFVVDLRQTARVGSKGPSDH
jgi:hypothetical protein